MGFTFGLGQNSMLNQYQRDVGNVRILDIAQNIQGRLNLPTANAGQYLDYVPKYVNSLMQRDQENDTNSTFLFEYQALLRSRMQQMVTELTAALTRDLDVAMSAVNASWADAGNARAAMQGYSEFGRMDAGAPRTAWNFFAGFTDTTKNANPTQEPFVGQDTAGDTTDPNQRVSPDTSSDFLWGHVRAIGTGAIQQGFVDDGLSTAILDQLYIGTTTTPGGDGVYASTPGHITTNVTPTRTIPYLNSNPSIGGYAIEEDRLHYGLAYFNTPRASNPNDDGFTADSLENMASGTLKAKNQFEMLLWKTMFEMENKKQLKDILRLSDRSGFLTNVQIASTTSLPTGSQVQASVFLNYVPDDPLKPHQGGRLQLVMDRFSAYYHS